MVKHFKNINVLFQYFIAAILLFQTCQLFAALPVIKRPVNDYANIISHSYEKRISNLIVNHRKKTGVQIAVLTIWSIRKESIEDYSLKVAEKWEGGSRERDDGLLFVIAVKNRKMRLEVGYGLEGYIPDSTAFRIISSIREDFRRKAFGKGVLKVINDVIKSTEMLRAGESIPVTGRILGLIHYTTSLYIIFYFLGGIIAAIFLIFRKRKKLNKPLTVIGFLFIIGIIPAIIQIVLPGAWFWRPLVFVAGILAGSGYYAGITGQKDFRDGAIIGNSIPVIFNIAIIIYILDTLKPNPFGFTTNETVLLALLIMSTLFELFIILVITADAKGGTRTYSSYGQSSWSSSSSSYSSSSSSSSWSGGGGSFGGGGASSSW